MKRSNKMVMDSVKNFTENKGHPFKIMLGFYKGEGWTLIKSLFLLILQNMPVWVLPIITTEIINAATYRNKTLSHIIMCAAIGLICVA